MSSSCASLAVLALTFAPVAAGIEVRASSEFARPDPFGGIVTPDRSGESTLSSSIEVRAARKGWASAHLIVIANAPAEFSVDVSLDLPVDLYREWFHRNKSDGQYYPDALIPVRMPFRSAIPDRDNKVPNATAAAFWLDIWIPANTATRTYEGSAKVTSGGGTSVLPIRVSVLPAVTPDEDAVTLDNNSYGTSWLFQQYPKTLSRTDTNDLFRLIHAYHRLFYEHRGTFHQLGYGHAGKVGPEFAPDIQGTGRSKHISSWDLFDRHYGPLLDGSAFRESRRGPKPIPWVYLPINPEWPASFEWWGEPGYETEFVNVVSEMEKHFREKGWTGTRFEMFFNHKKRYKGFSWDGDEIRFSRDNGYLIAYRKLLDKALPAASPVRFVFRLDTSWSMMEQFEKLRGIVNFWIAGEGILSWYPEAAARLRARGDTIWTYGGTPAVSQVSSEITLHPLRSWVTGVQGFVRWLTVNPGPDPWFALDGGTEVLAYPGDWFGSNEPLPSIRLKLQRNCLQDLALLERRATAEGRDKVLAEVVRRYNGSSLRDWSNSAPPLAATPVLEWDNVNIDEALQPFQSRFQNLRADAWLKVREYALGGRQ